MSHRRFVPVAIVQVLLGATGLILCYLGNYSLAIVVFVSVITTTAVLLWSLDP